jgi:hypothetical protein
MSRTIEAWLATLTPWQVCGLSVLAAILMEAITAGMRFGIGLQSTRDTGFIGYLTFGVRIHHGYFGILMLLVTWLRPEPVAWRHLAIIVGSGLVISDLMHHFLVLWPITGSPEFDLTYPTPRDDTRAPMP